MKKQITVSLVVSIILAILIVGYVGYSLAPKPRMNLSGQRDTVIVTDTVKVPHEVIRYVKTQTVAPIDSVTSDSVEVKVYTDSISDSTVSGTYRIQHTLVVDRYESDSARATWNVEIKPIETQVIKTIKETIYQDLIKEVSEPFYKNVWFYVSAIITAVTILLVR
jgi:hypothetical protein